MKKFVFLLFLLFCIFSLYYFGRNFFDKNFQNIENVTQKEIKVFDQSKQNNENINEKTKNNNFENINFDKQVETNRSIINKKFPGNYIDRSLKSGKLIRWNPSTFPLEVYVEYNSNLPDYYDKTVKKAFAQWQEESENFITFSFTNTEDYADIKCYFPENYKSENDGQRMIAGVTNFDYDEKLNYAWINFATYDMNNNFRTEDALYSTALHEIGHALGISGHSINESDIMYPMTKHQKAKISKNDINTLKLIYSIVPDVTNKNYSEADKNKYITTEDVLGDYDTRLDIELNATKEDLNSNKLSYFSGKYFNMANIYYKKKDYNNAIKNYQKGLTMTSDKKDTEAINMNIAICYNEIENYNKALEYVEISNSIKTTPEKLSFIANLYYKTGEYEKAKNLALDVLSKNPDNYNSYITLYHVYKHENNEEEIIKLHEQAKKYFPNNPPIKFGQ